MFITYHFFYNSTSVSLALQDAMFVTRSIFKIWMKLLVKKLTLRRKISFLRLRSLINQMPHTLVVQNGMYYARHAFHDNMKIAFYLGRRRRGSNVFRDDEILMELGDRIPVQCSCEFVKQQFCYFYNLFFFASKCWQLIYNYQLMFLPRKKYKIFLIVPSMTGAST